MPDSLINEKMVIMVIDLYKICVSNFLNVHIQYLSTFVAIVMKCQVKPEI